ncbi:HAD-IB family phosphatase [Sphingomonas sp. CGMCC 1.13654]|uniref:HAD-IB family phosphatase n=2 Tax=Sphingomonas chungangi TaxID=2683589 RepID=A0A838L775_9SPHN|nr:HAD-IB family phosphatase [Sphingomonas chungangi]MBA2934887.1 HAD-IB family phosphatase [Sphingomonas chungangi]
MDRTITRTGTYTPFLIHAALHRAPWRLLFLPFALLAMLGYALKMMTRARLKEINQSLLLGRRISRADLAPLTASFAERVWQLNTLPGALRQIEEDRAAGRRLVLATASYRLYVEAIAAKLRFDDVIATNSIIGIDARVTAKIDGENCYGPAKLRMIESWFRAEGIDRAKVKVRFYSDHASDAPVMEWADEPFAANPSTKMRALSAKRGWPIVDWDL